MTQFEATIWTKHNTVAMEKNLENYDFGLKDANVKSLKKNADCLKKSHECYQCIFSERPFEETFENAQWRKVTQMPPLHTMHWDQDNIAQKKLF